MYRLELSRTAHGQIIRLPAGTQDRINGSIARLSENPCPRGSIKLTASEGHRLRAGDYRVLYQVFDTDNRVTIFRVMSRGSVYRH